LIAARAALSDVEVASLLSVQRFRRGRLPLWLRWSCDRLLSTHPFYDASLAAWLAAIALLPIVGYPIWWCMSVNVVASFALSRYPGGAAPADVEPRIKSRGRVSPSGFPCVEVQLASCLATVVATEFRGEPLAGAVGALYVAALALLRLYGCTHFPSQLLASLALGASSVPALYAIAALFIEPGTVNGGLQFLAALPLGMLFVGYAAYRAETNDMPFARIPKAEFERVLTEIARGDDATVTQEMPGRATRRRGGAAVDAEIAMRALAAATSGDRAGMAAAAVSAARARATDNAGGAKRVSFAPGYAPAASDYMSADTDAAMGQQRSQLPPLPPPASLFGRRGQFPPAGPKRSGASDSDSDVASFDRRARGDLARSSLASMLGEMRPLPRPGTGIFDDPDVLPGVAVGSAGSTLQRDMDVPFGASAPRFAQYNSAAMAPAGKDLDEVDEEDEEDDDDPARPKRDSFYWLLRDARRRKRTGIRPSDEPFSMSF
jgi:hypothetical protein